MQSKQTIFSRRKILKENSFCNCNEATKEV